MNKYKNDKTQSEAHGTALLSRIYSTFFYNTTSSSHQIIFNSTVRSLAHDSPSRSCVPYGAYSCTSACLHLLMCTTTNYAISARLLLHSNMSLPFHNLRSPLIKSSRSHCLPPLLHYPSFSITSDISVAHPSTSAHYRHRIILSDHSLLDHTSFIFTVLHTFPFLNPVCKIASLSL